ncbi:MAG: Spy/CpxP family protein refolding chaperone, partial [Pseudomonadota bacterium]
AGHQERTVASLSADDIAALRAGKGWGFALSAELNGYPGPLHVLELSDELALSAEQRARAESLFNEMAAAAKSLGPRFISAEKAVDQVFKAGAPTQAAVSRATQKAGALRAQLRTVHLSAHIAMAQALTAEQRKRYAQLRGYAGDQSHRGSHTTGTQKRGSHSH